MTRSYKPWILLAIFLIFIIGPAFIVHWLVPPPWVPIVFGLLSGFVGGRLSAKVIRSKKLR